MTEDLSFYIVAGVIYTTLGYIILKGFMVIYRKLNEKNLSPMEREALAQVARTKLNTIGAYEAVQYVMSRTGWSFKKSLSFCRQLGPCDITIAKPAPVNNPLDYTNGGGGPIAEDELEKIVKQKLRSIGKLETIKFIKEHTKWDLKEAKDFCDKLESELNTVENDISDMFVVKAKPIAQGSKLAEQYSGPNTKKRPKGDLFKKKSDSDFGKTTGNSSDNYTNTMDLQGQINQIIAKTGWTPDQAQAYIQRTKEYEAHTQKSYQIKND